MTLPPREQELWFAYEIDRLEQLSKFKEALSDKDVLTAESLTLIRLYGDLL